MAFLRVLVVLLTLTSAGLAGCLDGEPVGAVDEEPVEDPYLGDHRLIVVLNGTGWGRADVVATSDRTYDVRVVHEVHGEITKDSAWLAPMEDLLVAFSGGTSCYESHLCAYDLRWAAPGPHVEMHDQITMARPYLSQRSVDIGVGEEWSLVVQTNITGLQVIIEPQGESEAELTHVQRLFAHPGTTILRPTLIPEGVDTLAARSVTFRVPPMTRETREGFFLVRITTSYDNNLPSPAMHRSSVGWRTDGSCWGGWSLGVAPPGPEDSRWGRAALGALLQDQTVELCGSIGGEFVGDRAPRDPEALFMFVPYSYGAEPRNE